MVNRNLFATKRDPVYPTDTRNDAGGTAYAFAARHALAQFAMTGSLGGTYYSAPEEELKSVLELLGQVESEYVAKLARYARREGHRKDLPAVLTAHLAATQSEFFAGTFRAVIDSPKMLRNFVQVIRSGVLGRRSFGSLPKRLIREWFDRQTPESLFRAQIGGGPKLRDLLRMVHPKPKSESQSALYAYLLGQPVALPQLPELVQEYENRRTGVSAELPDLPFELLTSLQLTDEEWKILARRCSWQTLRMSLATFARHGVFEDEALCEEICTRLKDPQEIARARVLPAQVFIAWKTSEGLVPAMIREALDAALPIAMARIPSFEPEIAVLIDVSGSMGSPVSGNLGASTSKVRCVEAAAVIAATIRAKNAKTIIVPFHHEVPPFEQRPDESAMVLADRLTSLPSGGTDCACGLEWLRKNKRRAELVIMLSDNESWISNVPLSYGQTGTLSQWERYRKGRPNARLVCWDLQPNRSTQGLDREDILNVGGFTDSGFDLIREFVLGISSAGRWVEHILAEPLEAQVAMPSPEDLTQD